VTAPRVAGLALADQVVLALLAEQPMHGWAIVRALAPGGEIGRVWSLSRPLAYRSIDLLLDRRLLRAAESEPGQGARRRILTPTAAGRRVTSRWLAAPVEHLRHVRTELLLKVVLARRRGVDPRPLLHEQAAVFAPIQEGLEDAARAPDADAVDRWRVESARAVRRFLEEELRRS
jgi:DNA-binding PadR family transcriptional regulator